MTNLIENSSSFRVPLMEAAQEYKNNFVEKEVTYTYRDKTNKRGTLTIQAQPQNFMHLCGITCYGDGLGTPQGEKIQMEQREQRIFIEIV